MMVFDNNIIGNLNSAWNLKFPLLSNHMQLWPGSIDENCIVLLTMKYCIILIMDLFRSLTFCYDWVV